VPLLRDDFGGAVLSLLKGPALTPKGEIVVPDNERRAKMLLYTVSHSTLGLIPKKKARLLMPGRTLMLICSNIVAVTLGSRGPNEIGRYAGDSRSRVYGRTSRLETKVAIWRIDEIG
jgi:hypothetical protein